MSNKDGILKELYKNDGSFVSGTKLAQLLGVSRTAVWKDIISLKKEGYPIRASKKKGYTLDGRPSSPMPFEVTWGLDTKIIGREVVYFETVGSTNDIAKEMAEKDAEEGLVVIAEKQTSGRGRLDRSWVSQRGGLYLSILLRPKMEPEHLQQLTLIAGLAAMRTVESYGLEAAIKWVNDVRINGKKVCGVLTEVSGSAEMMGYAVVGVGLNVNNRVSKFPKDVRDIATSLKDEGASASLADVARRLLKQFDTYYQRILGGGFSEILNEWKASCDTIGKRVRIVRINEVIEGTAMDVDEGGALIVETAGAVERVTAGDVIYLD
ncbi:MAG: biotin--[acetyl-CoA-carboxylase] ligase [Candidatus Hydrothermarchaeales archaeon]